MGIVGQSLAEFATIVLRDRLIVLDIPPGAPINDEAIGRELGVGRTPVREAVKRLEAEHLVTVFPRRGTFAAGIDITDLAEISEIRAQLEPLAASRAARFASPDARRLLADLADGLAALDLDDTSATELMRRDLEIHRAIYAANGNRHLADVLTRYDNLATRIWCLVLDRLPDVAPHVTEHAALLSHIVDGDAAAAEATARAHVTEFERLVRSVL